MVMMVLWGLISPQLLNKVMLLLVKDLELLQAVKLDVSGIRKLAKLGSSGGHPEHTWRDFCQFLPKPKLPKLQKVMFPLKHTSLGRFSKALPLLLPHTHSLQLSTITIQRCGKELFTLVPGLAKSFGGL